MIRFRDLIPGRRAAPPPPVQDEQRLLVVRVDGVEVAAIGALDIPCEVEHAVAIDGAATIEFEDVAGVVHRHHVPAYRGWLHLNVRIHPNLGCQADAVATANPEHTAGAAVGDDEIGMRFQPFILFGGAAIDLRGRGLFARGLHFSGLVTPGNILLSCECDHCAQTFIARSFHAGFAQSGYFYSESGHYTLVVDGAIEGAPVPLSDPEPGALAALEARLPLAPDGTGFAYRNAFRCPHCSAPYVDFIAHPEQRAGEYYGLYLPDTPPIRFAGSGATG